MKTLRYIGFAILLAWGTASAQTASLSLPGLTGVAGTTVVVPVAVFTPTPVSAGAVQRRFGCPAGGKHPVRPGPGRRAYERLHR